MLHRWFCTVLIALLLSLHGIGAAQAVEVWLPEWTWAYPEQLADLLNEFAAANPTYHLSKSGIAGSQKDYEAKLLTAVAGGSAPDLAFFNRASVIELVAGQGMLRPIGDVLARSGISLDSFPAGLIGEMTFGAQVYGIPFTFDVRGLYYNTAHFGAAGLPDTRPPQTFEELDDWARKLTRMDQGEITQLGFVPTGNNWGGMGWLWSWGGEAFDWNRGVAIIDRPANLDAMRWVKSYGEQYSSAAVDAFWKANAAPGAPGESGFAAFLAGRQAMVIQSSAELTITRRGFPEIEFAFGPVPHAQNGRNGTWAGGGVFVIPQGAKNLEGAGKLLAFLASPQAQLRYFETTQNLPPNLEALRRVARAKSDAAFTSVIAIAPLINQRPPAWRFFNSNMNTAISNVFSNQQSPEEALVKAEQAVAVQLGNIRLTENWR